MDKVIKVEKILQFIKDRGISKTKFCKECGVSYQCLKKILSDNLNFYADAIFKIARFMKLNVYELFWEKKDKEFSEEWICNK